MLDAILRIFASPGIFLNEKGEKRRNMICDLCGTNSNYPVDEVEDRAENESDEGDNP
jgi:hypothetical protein